MKDAAAEPFRRPSLPCEESPLRGVSGDDRGRACPVHRRAGRGWRVVRSCAVAPWRGSNGEGTPSMRPVADLGEGLVAEFGARMS